MINAIKSPKSRINDVSQQSRATSASPKATKATDSALKAAVLRAIVAYEEALATFDEWDGASDDIISNDGPWEGAFAIRDSLDDARNALAVAIHDYAEKQNGRRYRGDHSAAHFDHDGWRYTVMDSGEMEGSVYLEPGHQFVLKSHLGND